MVNLLSNGHAALVAFSKAAKTARGDRYFDTENYLKERSKSREFGAARVEATTLGALE